MHEAISALRVEAAVDVVTGEADDDAATLSANMHSWWCCCSARSAAGHPEEKRVSIPE